jgi:hypothetical protein
MRMLSEAITAVLAFYKHIGSGVIVLEGNRATQLFSPFSHQSKDNLFAPT